MGYHSGELYTLPDDVPSSSVSKNVFIIMYVCVYVYACVYVHVLYAYLYMLVFHSQAIFLAYVLYRNKGSGNHFKLFLVFPCYKICKISGMLNGDDKAKETMIF